MTDLGEELDRLEGLVKKAHEAKTGPSTIGTAHVTVSAGPVGLWATVTACLMMVAMNIVLAAVVVSHARQIDDLNHYLNAIYMVAPHLKPEEGES